MIRSAAIVFPIALLVALCAVAILHFQVPLGPLILVLGGLPLVGVRASDRALPQTVS